MKMNFFAIKERIEAHPDFLEAVENALCHWNNIEGLIESAGSASKRQIIAVYETLIQTESEEACLDLLRDMLDRRVYFLAVRKDLQDVLRNIRDKGEQS